MNCPRCGEVCRCDSEPLPGPLSLLSSAADSGRGGSFDGVGMMLPDPEVAGAPAEAADLNASRDLAVASLSSGGSGPDAAAENEDADAWRGEISARLNRYRARRKVRPNSSKRSRPTACRRWQ